MLGVSRRWEEPPAEGGREVGGKGAPWAMADPMSVLRWTHGFSLGAQVHREPWTSILHSTYSLRMSPKGLVSSSR